MTLSDVHLIRRALENVSANCPVVWLRDRTWRVVRIENGWWKLYRHDRNGRVISPPMDYRRRAFGDSERMIDSMVSMIIALDAADEHRGKGS